jgi:hypothetical protein
MSRLAGDVAGRAQARLDCSRWTRGCFARLVDLLAVRLAARRLT